MSSKCWTCKNCRSNPSYPISLGTIGCPPTHYSHQILLNQLRSRGQQRKQSLEPWANAEPSTFYSQSNFLAWQMHWGEPSGHCDLITSDNGSDSVTMCTMPQTKQDEQPISQNLMGQALNAQTPFTGSARCRHDRLTASSRTIVPISIKNRLDQTTFHSLLAGV